jgi:hypothetical protein
LLEAQEIGCLSEIPISTNIILTSKGTIFQVISENKKLQIIKRKSVTTEGI